MLVKTRNEMDFMIIPFQIAAVTMMSFLVTSDNPISTDDDWWYGYHLSFALIICFSLVIIANITYKFASSKKRMARFLELYAYVYIGTLAFGFINIFKSDGAPWKTDIRRVWASILIGIILAMPILLLLLNKIGKLVILIVFTIPKKLLMMLCCKETPH
jgi:hypothetical protein